MLATFVMALAAWGACTELGDETFYEPAIDAAPGPAIDAAPAPDSDAGAVDAAGVD